MRATSRSGNGSKRKRASCVTGIVVSRKSSVVFQHVISEIPLSVRGRRGYGGGEAIDAVRKTQSAERLLGGKFPDIPLIVGMSQPPPFCRVDMSLFVATSSAFAMSALGAARRETLKWVNIFASYVAGEAV